MTKQAANVIPMTQDSPDFVQARAFASIRAIDVVREKMEGQLKTSTKDWSNKLDETTRSYRTILRDELEGIDRISQKAAKDHFIEVVKLLAERDRINEAKQEDQKARKKRIEILKAAFSEIRGIASASTEQGDLFGSTGGIRGMAWASKATCDAIYSALLVLHEDGKLDAYQDELLVDLGKSGLERIDLGIDAAEAIEQDTEAAEREDDEDTEEPEAFEFPD